MEQGRKEGVGDTHLEGQPCPGNDLEEPHALHGNESVFKHLQESQPLTPKLLKIFLV